jgi:hypothetical protein
MSVKDYSNTVLGRLNSALLGWISTGLQLIAFGAVIRSLRTFLRNKSVDATTNPYVLQMAVNSLTLAESAKCHTIKSVYARAGAGAKGALTIDHGLYNAVNTAPAAGHCSVAPNGDLLFAAADAWTALDICYEPEKYDVVELTLPVSGAAGVATIPAQYTARGVLFLMESESLSGALTAKLMIQAPADTLPASTFSALNLAKTEVHFAAADAVTSARVKFAVASAIDVDGLLEGTSPAV